MNLFIRYSGIYLIGGVLLALLGSACSNDFELNASGDPIPVVYCLLNPDASEQYVRLGRSFLTDPNNPGKPPVTDSTVWNMAVTVYIEEWQNGSPVKMFRFEPAKAPAKDSGFFPGDNLRIFKADFQPIRTRTYHLYVHFPDDDRIVAGVTTIGNPPEVHDPMDLPGRKINLQSGVQFVSRWAPGDGQGIFQVSFAITYLEEMSGQREYHRVDLISSPLLGLGTEIEMTDIVSGTRFLTEMARQVPVTEGAIRTVIGLQYKLFKGGEELALMVSPDLQQTSISNNLNQYTNLENGMGVFSSLQLVTVNNLELSNTTINELATGELTRNLGFLDIHGGEPDMKKQ